jgi:hypothetical protein
MFKKVFVFVTTHSDKETGALFSSGHSAFADEAEGRAAFDVNVVSRFTPSLSRQC